MSALSLSAVMGLGRQTGITESANFLFTVFISGQSSDSGFHGSTSKMFRTKIIIFLRKKNTSISRLNAKYFLFKYYNQITLKIINKFLTVLPSSNYFPAKINLYWSIWLILLIFTRWDSFLILNFSFYVF